MSDLKSGVLLLHKPTGMSSRQALDHVTRLVPQHKMGHAGTLDPMASGLLVVCVGKATRLISYVQEMRKEYRASVRFGQRSSTHDLEGTVEDARFAGQIDSAMLQRCLQKYCGEILQVPPQHSAVHVAGRRAYELARSGQRVELDPRPVRIDRFVSSRFEYPEADFEIFCSSGTYVRSLVRDIGEDLGCGAVMTSLVRTAIGRFRIEEAVTLEQLTLQSFRMNLRPPQAAVQDLPPVTVSPHSHDDIRHGRPITTPVGLSKFPDHCEFVLCDSSGEVLAVATSDATGQTLRPKIVLIPE